MSIATEKTTSFPTSGHVLFVADPDPTKNCDRVKELLAHFPQATYPANCEDRTLLTLPGDSITFLVWIERRKRLNSQLGRALKQLLTTCIQHLSVIYHFGPSKDEHDQWDKLYGDPLKAFVDRYKKMTVTVYQPRCYFLVGDPYFHKHVTEVQKTLHSLPAGSHVVWIGGLPMSTDNVIKYATAARLWHHIHDAPGGVITKAYATVFDIYRVDEIFIFSAPKDITNLVVKMAAKRQLTATVV